MLEMQYHMIIPDVLPLTNTFYIYLLYVLCNAKNTGFNYQYI